MVRTANEMCWFPRTTSNSCRPFLSGSGQFLSSSLRASSVGVVGVGASEVHSQRVVVVGGRRSSRVGAPNELAVLNDAPQLGQDGLPHVNCAHAQRLRLGSRGKHE